MLFIMMMMMYKMVLWMKSNCVIIQMKSIEQYFPVVLFFNTAQGGSNHLHTSLCMKYLNESYQEELC